MSVTGEKTIESAKVNLDLNNLPDDPVLLHQLILDLLAFGYVMYRSLHPNRLPILITKVSRL